MSSSATAFDGGSPIFDDAMASKQRKELQELKQEVLLLYQDYTLSPESPPFTAGEMIIMALIQNDNAPLNRVDILTWILKTFRFYSNLFITKVTAILVNEIWYRTAADVRGIVPGYDQAFWQYDLPIRLASYDLHGDPDKNTYVAHARSARMYLRRLLEPPREKTFNFLALSGELRNILYEMTLSYPRSGIRMPGHYSLRATPTLAGDLMVQRRESDLGGSHMSWEPAGDEAIILPPMKQILAILLVCRQISSEATPIFYSINTFIFSGPQTLLTLSNRVAVNRFSNITKVVIDIRPWDMDAWMPFARMLAARKPFEFLGLKVSDEAWLKMCASDRAKLGRRTAYTKIKQIPGFSDLAVALAKAKVFELAGEESSEIKKYLEEEVLNIKAKAEAEDHKASKQTNKVKARRSASSKKVKGTSKTPKP